VHSADRVAELTKGIEELSRRRASLQEKMAFLDRYFAKWGYPP
jgi:hypothetical protein